MSKLYYTTTNGDRDGRASMFFRDVSAAEKICSTQNDEANKLGLSISYEVASCDESSIAGDLVKQIR